MSTLSPLAADSSLHDRVGFMQGRMSAPSDGRVQAFPWSSWREEFSVAEKNGFRLMEWTLDQDQLYENPLMTVAGQVEIRALVQRYGVGIPSLTGDCFMQAPFWKAHGENRESLTRDFLAVAAACCKVGISMLIVPLVDNGRLESSWQEDILVEFLRSERPYFEALGLRVLFESDFESPALRRFIERLDSDSFGINYDIGNSAALNFDPVEEIATYGHRIMNVHVKDRKLGGTTVPLGEGAANFELVFSVLRRAGYASNFILQTARSPGGDHVGALRRYRDMTVDWLRRAEEGRLAS
ncbi:sugar phosphate isomerase/epimerase family protein [Candidatus Methylomirabilis sp.]|uniref:sugar phosphate isomerase/epimerase family protein n=1 Tax=Candidatus Methylomirabilis sp. TaxID=2032687 RepID=UPI002A67FBA5|nr:sugar phosphate isomerase/epimerase [Candidatus Methylomirabilis sp.]